MKKLCAVFHGVNKPFEVREYEVSSPAPGIAGLTLLASGICGTDIHIHQGYIGMPDMELILGHEFTGKIDAIGGDKLSDALGNRLSVGDNVISCVAIPCGKCLNCRRGETASCLNFGVTYARDVNEAPHFHGGYAEYLFAPVQNLVRIPDNVSPLVAASFPCGGPTVIRACEYGGGLAKGEFVVIQGNGALGIFALAWAKKQGCRVGMVGSCSNAKRQQLTEALQPEFFLDYHKVSEDEINAKVHEYAAAHTGGNGADVVIETSGSRDALPLGLTLLRTRGRYFVPGQYSNRGPVSIMPQDITFRALQIIGSGQYTMADLGTYLNFLQANSDLQALFEKSLTKYSVRDVNQAVQDMAEGKVIKAVFV